MPKVCNWQQLVGHVVRRGTDILLRSLIMLGSFQISFLVLYILLCDLRGLVK